MMLNDDNKQIFKKFLKKRAVFLALGVCVLAAGIASYSSVLSKITPVKIPGEETEIITHINIDERIFDETAAASEKPEPVSEAATQPPATEAAPVFDNNSPTVEQQTSAEEETTESELPVFSLPLSFSIGDDYSMGLPVFSDTMGDYRTHNGVDFRGEQGEAVRATAAGTVTSVTKSPLFGNTVTIDHGGSMQSTICGLADEGLIEEGVSVTSDTVIGLVGKIPSEEKEGSHIHLEIRRNGSLTDPLEFFGLSSPDD